MANESFFYDGREKFPGPCCLWIDTGCDTFLNEFFESYTGSFGVEIGFGEVPTNPALLDENIPWLFFEGDEKSFCSAKKTYQLPSTQNIMYPPYFFLNTWANPDIVKRAQIAVFRNFETQDMGRLVPSRTKLEPGQRVVIIVDGLHGKNERTTYNNFLSNIGYGMSPLRMRDKNLPSLTPSYASREPVWMMDCQNE